MKSPKVSFSGKIKTLFFGRKKDLSDPAIFHKLSLVAFFAWIGLGSDGLSSSCYGPEEAFLALQGHVYLAVFVALATVFTIIVISASYSQIIELFPAGGGGYVVGTKLLSPAAGMVSGCALLIDYVLTIAISVACSADALFSFLPASWLEWKLWVAVGGVLILTMLNLRGVKESVLAMLPIFLVFILTHAGAIFYAVFSHSANIPAVAANTLTELRGSYGEIGFIGIMVLLLRSYSMGAGTYTGIEAVSNGVSILRQPQVQTAKRTMRYMTVSLVFVVSGLILSYLLYGVQPVHGKTLNAVLFGSIFGNGNAGYVLLLLTLLSEAAILFVAAQTGFLDGPRVIASMARDKWFPARFTILSDRLVTQNGIMLMGISAFTVMLLTGGSVKFLVVLYSINVFITFVLSQLGMVRYWWSMRKTAAQWRKKITVNGVGLVLSSFILVSIVAMKFNEGGWITIFITGTLVVLVIAIKRHYLHTARLLRRLDPLATSVPEAPLTPLARLPCDPQGKTAVIMVNGFNGLGLHTLFGVLRLFKGVFRNFVIVQVGIIDASSLKGPAEISAIEMRLKEDAERYVAYISQNGYYAEAFFATGVDVVEEISNLAPRIRKKFPNAIFFGGQLVFPEKVFASRWLHNYTVFAIQRKFYYEGTPVMLLPIRL